MVRRELSKDRWWQKRRCRDIVILCPFGIFRRSTSTCTFISVYLDYSGVQVMYSITSSRLATASLMMRRESVLPNTYGSTGQNR